MTQPTYDVIVIGAGPGGYTAAALTAESGSKTLLIEKNKIGGTCLHTGCIPSKTYLHAGYINDLVSKSSKFGIKTSTSEISWEALNKQKDRVVSRLQRGLEQMLKENNVDVVMGEVHIQNESTIQVGETTYSFKKLILATGSSPIMPAAWKSQDLTTSDTLFNREQQPKSLAIIGGGIIGIEMAETFANLGSEVTLIEKLDRLVPAEDSEVSKFYETYLRRKKVNVKTGHEVKSIEELGVDEVIVAMGRKPSTFGLKELELKSSEKGLIETNEHFQTSRENVYLIGDTVGHYQLAHEAISQAKVVAAHLHGKSFPYSRAIIPRVIYTHPECAIVGITETELKEKKIDFQKVTVNLSDIGKAHTQDEMEGFASLFFDKKTKLILGCILIIPDASNLIPLITLAINEKITLEKLSEISYPHPSLSEILNELFLKSLNG